MVKVQITDWLCSILSQMMKYLLGKGNSWYIINISIIRYFPHSHYISAYRIMHNNATTTSNENICWSTNLKWLPTPSVVMLTTSTCKSQLLWNQSTNRFLKPAVTKLMV
jgi:hypothetical protein